MHRLDRAPATADFVLGEHRRKDSAVGQRVPALRMCHAGPISYGRSQPSGVGRQTMERRDMAKKDGVIEVEGTIVEALPTRCSA